jgi:hypothetical protein
MTEIQIKFVVLLCLDAKILSVIHVDFIDVTPPIAWSSYFFYGRSC